MPVGGTDGYDPAAMTRLPGAIALFTLALNLFLVDGLLRAQSFAGSQHGLVVLRSGDVLKGKLSRADDRIVVALDGGGEVRLPPSLVDFRARDVADAYARLAERADDASAAQQLDLAEWCLRQHLYAEAGDRLLAATVLDPKHPGIRRIERRLWLVTHPPEIAAETSPRQDPSQLASIRRAIESLPPGAVESFTTTVQPILLNRCAGCHRPAAGTSFRLLRPLRGGVPPRSFTDHNLSAVMQQIDRDRPAKSPLLAASRGPHGGVGANSPLIEEGQRERIAEWIRALNRPSRLYAQGAAAPREAVLWQPGVFLPGLDATMRGAAAMPDAASGDAASAGMSSAGTSSFGAESARNARSSARSADASLTDPFDPEVFNRRYFPD